MEVEISADVLAAYGLDINRVNIEKLGLGHINQTFLISTASHQKYILQNINTLVFTEPELISQNIALVSNYLKVNFPEYLFPAPLPALDGSTMIKLDDQYWRMSPFISDSVSYLAVAEPKQAYEAAKQFGKLSRLLDGFDASQLNITIPGFHDLAWRFTQFQEALANTDFKKRELAAQEIERTQHFHYIVDFFESFQRRHDFPQRVMHHDTKVSNVLLRRDTNEGICVIDLDTLMPGKFISDLGDMMRTYLSAFSEEEEDLDKITIRIPFFEATIKGYLSEMAPYLTSTEKELVLFSGKYIIYMQAIRFLTDYLNGSIYYPINHPTHNLIRSKNQFKLLQELVKNEKILQDIINENL
ncbi:MAG: aminoglycoside phosphotransferase family protein [Pedobacter sp.]|nr:MAG: aminoglycoside phosphotransferase family protein [Pedobacter sp.]